MSNLNTAPTEQRETLPRMEYMRDALVEATYTSDRVLDPNIVALNLVHPDVDMLEMVNTMRAAMLRDPQHRERGISMWVASHKLIVPRDPNDMTVGDERSVLPKAPPVKTFFGDVGGEQILLRTKQLAAMPHTHNRHSPPSPADLKPLLYDDDEDTFYTATAAWVITPEGTGVVFRGPGTRSLSIKEFDQLEQTWLAQTQNERVARMGWLATGKKYDRLWWEAYTNQYNRVMSQHDLQFFAGGVGESVLLKQTMWR